MDILAMVVLALALCVPAVAVVGAASAWRARLRRPRAFVVLGLALLYALAACLLTRPIPTHAVTLALDAGDFGDSVRQASVAFLRRLAWTTLLELAAASALVVFALRRLLSRPPPI